VDVDKIAFTGSVEVGKLIMQAAGKSNLKKISLELGGKSPNIVFADADMDVAREGAAAGIFYNMGQDCTAGSRVFVEQRVDDDVAEYMAAHSKNPTISHGLDESTDIGPLVSTEQIERVLGHVQLGRQEGARVLSGGERVAEGERARGFFVRPTVFADARNDVRIAQEEIFGPVVSVIPFRGVEDVVRQGNNVVYGLGAGLWTKERRRS
jgi:aldehyde dehydrogenase (NAD+)